MSWFEDEIPQYTPDYAVDVESLRLVGWTLDMETVEVQEIPIVKVKASSNLDTNAKKALMALTMQDSAQASAEILNVSA